MDLVQRIAADLTDAMKRKDASVVDTLRMLRAATKNAEIEKRRPLEEPETVAVIRSSIKQIKDARQDFLTGGRQDLVDKADAETAVLGKYLPAELTDDELKAIVEEAVAASGAAGPKDFGKAMGAAMKAVAGRAEGGRVGELVKARLGS